MKNVFKKYIWLWEMIGAALLLGLGFVMGFVNAVLLVMVGLIFIFLGVLRFIPLLKTTDDKVLKWFYAIELIIDIIAGVVLLIIGIKGEDNSAIFKLFGYIIGGILYLRGFVYLFSSSVRKEEAKLLIFIIHIALITLGTVIIARGGFTLATLGWILLAISAICSIIIAFDGAHRYKIYRNNEQSTRLTKKVKKQKQDDSKIDAPTADEIKERVPKDDQDISQDHLNA